MVERAREALATMDANGIDRARGLTKLEALAEESEEEERAWDGKVVGARETLDAREDDDDAETENEDGEDGDARRGDGEERSTTRDETMVKYEETVALLRAQTAALRESHDANDALEDALEDARVGRENIEAEAMRRMRDVREEMETLRGTLREVVESRTRARDAAAREAARADAAERARETDNEERGREVESLKAELALARSNAESAARVMTTKSGVEVTAELYEQSHASEKKAMRDSERAKKALVEQKKTLDALEKRLRDTRARADLAEAKCRELKTAQKRWERLESNGDAAFAQSPPSSTTPRTLRQSHRDVREYAAQRVGSLENDVKSTKREATLASADFDSKLAEETGARSAMQGSLENARARIRVLEGERDALRARVEAAEAEVSDLKMSLKLTEERAAQAEETAAKEIAVAMEAVNRVHTAEDALGEFSAEAEAERAKAVDAKSAMKSREFGDKLRELQDRVERAESDRDAAVERAKTAEEARFKAESELERSRSSPAGKDLADARRRLRQAEDRARDAEEELSNLRHAALAGRRAASEAIVPSIPRPRARVTDAAPSAGFRLARPNSDHRAAAAELASSLRAKLESSSPSVRKTQRRSQTNDLDASFTTPTKRA